MTAAVLVADALDALTDAAARAALATTTLARGVRPGGPAPAWLAALAGPRRDFTVDPAALDTLRAELDAWQRDAAGGAVRASFRLVEPAPDEVTEPILATRPGPAEIEPTLAEPIGGGRWRLEFGLQAADEPSLHVDAGQVWRAPQTLGGPHRPSANPQETLLAELGRASRLWPDLDAALRTAAPEALELDAEGAHRFLREGAPVLHAAGFGVLLPSWWSARRRGWAPGCAPAAGPRPARSPAPRQASGWTRSSTTAGRWRSATSRCPPTSWRRWPS